METIVKLCALCSSEVASGGVLCLRHEKQAQKTSSKSSRFENTPKKIARAPFVSVEIETSGLDPKRNSLLEVVMILGDFGQIGGGISNRIHLYIRPEKKIIWDKEAKKRVGHLEKFVTGKEVGEGKLVGLSEAREIVKKFLSKCLKDSGGWKNQLLGKNIYGFITPFLKANDLFFEELIDHNSLDYRSLFYIPFGQRVELKRVCMEYKIPLVDDSALNEAITMLSTLYEAVAHRENLSTTNWY